MTEENTITESVALQSSPQVPLLVQCGDYKVNPATVGRIKIQKNGSAIVWQPGIAEPLTLPEGDWELLDAVCDDVSYGLTEEGLEAEVTSQEGDSETDASSDKPKAKQKKATRRKTKKGEAAAE